MTRESRTLLVVGLLAIGGISALAFMANRYAAMRPLKSVEDIPAAEDAVPAEPESAEPTGEAAAAVEDPTSAVERFIEVRREVVDAIDADPGMKSRMQKELSGQARNAPSRVHYKLLIQVKAAREEGLARVELPEQEYHRVRESFLAWVGHRFAEGEADPVLVPEFERRRAELEPLYLEILETLDQ